MKPFWKTLTFWISAIAWLALMGGHYAGMTPPPYGLVLANGVAVLYAVLRCLQKRKIGITWKSIFLTSEFAGTTCTVLVNLFESLMKLPVLSPKLLGALSAAISGLLWILHILNGAVKPGQFGIPWQPASETVVTKPLHLPDTNRTTTKE